MTKTNVYQKIVNFLNQNNLMYSEKLYKFHKCLTIDGSASNNYYFVSLSYKDNSKTVITDITFDIENLHGELGRIELRISYNQLIKQLGDQIDG